MLNQKESKRIKASDVICASPELRFYIESKRINANGLARNNVFHIESKRIKKNQSKRCHLCKPRVKALY